MIGPTHQFDRRIAYAKGAFGVLALLGGAYLVGHGALLMAAGTVFMLSATVTLLRTEHAVGDDCYAPGLRTEATERSSHVSPQAGPRS
jgi:hypothetical protein